MEKEKEKERNDRKGEGGGGQRPFQDKCLTTRRLCCRDADVVDLRVYTIRVEYRPSRR